MIENETSETRDIMKIKWGKLTDEEKKLRKAINRKKREQHRYEKKIAHQHFIKVNKEKNLELYGRSKKSLKHMRNIIRKLYKIDNTIDYKQDIESYATNWNYYVNVVKENIINIDEVDSLFVSRLLNLK